MSRAKKIKCQLRRAGLDLFEDYQRETKYVSKIYPKYATTKYKELGYAMTASREWRFVDLNCPSSTGNPAGPSCIGPHYRSETDLLSDLDNFAEQFGCEDAKARPFATQPQVDAIVRIMRSLSRRCEATKDAKENESRSFWFWHDAMMYIDQVVAHLTKKGG